MSKVWYYKKRFGMRVFLWVALVVGASWAQNTPIGFASVEGTGSKYLKGGTTGGAGGDTVRVSNQTDLEQYITASEPYVILVEGQIMVSPKGKEFRVASHKTLLGVGANSGIRQGGFFLGSGVHNVIFRNLHIGDSYLESDPDGKEQDWDGIQMDNAHHVWIDHCRFYKIGDGMIDSRKNTDYVTVSWSIFEDHNKVFGIGWTEDLDARLTIHHNWFRRLYQRNPSCDNAYCHLYNNYMEDLESYGHYARGRASMVVENSIFKNVNNPWYHDDTANLTASGNVTEGSTGGKKFSNGKGFNPNDYYSYTLDAVEDLKELLALNAGPQEWVGTSEQGPVSVDCAGVVDGQAQRDDCGRCVWGTTGKQPCDFALQAQEYCTANGVVETTHSGYTGSGYLNLENSTSATVMYKVHAQNAGAYDFAVKFANGGSASRPAQVQVNGVPVPEHLEFGLTGAWANWQVEELQVQLHQGVNSIELIPMQGEGAPNLDVIGVVQAGVSVANCEEVVGIMRLQNENNTSSPAPVPAITQAKTPATKNGFTVVHKDENKKYDAVGRFQGEGLYE
jgi:pectate lyase